MKYYILISYENERQKLKEKQKKMKKKNLKYTSIVCLVLMLFMIVLLMLATLLQKKGFSIICSVILSICLMSFLIAEKKERKNYVQENIELYKEKIDILQKILIEKFNINTREKIEDLINIYQESVNKKIDKAKKRERLIVAIYSIVVSMLTVSLENMEIINLQFTDWLNLTVILLIIIMFAVVLIYFDTYFDPYKTKYELMIENLKELIILKY